MKISIIVPVYNTEEYIEQCLQSLVAQTYRDIEIIVITEPCNDGSEALCDLIAEKDPRIKVIHKSQLTGVSNSRNIGIKVASGEYILFVDSDDYIDSNMVERLLRTKEDKGVDIVKCGIRVLENNTCFIQTPNLVFDEKMYFPDAFRYILGDPGDKNYGGNIWNTLFPKKCIHSHDGTLILMDETLNYAEDVHWLIRILLNVESICFIKDPLYNYRRNRDGNTFTTMYKDKKLKYSESAIKSYADISRILKEKGVRTWKNAYWRLIVHQLRAYQSSIDLNDKQSERTYKCGLIKMIFTYLNADRSLTGLKWSAKALCRLLIVKVRKGLKH